MKIFLRGLHSCVMRKADVERYRAGLELAGHAIVSKPDESDVILVWTCAFREDFRNNSIKVLKEYQEKFASRVIACGCLPSIDPHLLRSEFSGEYFEWKNEAAAMRELFGVDVSRIPRPVVERSLLVPIDEYKSNHPEVKTTHCDQFAKLYISEGCTFNCTYCAEILAFPPYKSFPLAQLVDNCAEGVAKSGAKKVVLHGDCVGEYGKDINGSLPQLVEALLASIPGLQIGLKNLHPINVLEYLDFFIRHIGNKNISLIETPIQSASNKILQLMNRLYSKDDLVKIFRSFRECGFKELETHIIVGFPSETEEQYQETVDFICEYKPKYALISGFMESGKMEASRMQGKVSRMERRRRVISAYEKIRDKGVICNFDECDYCKEHFLYPLVEGLFC